MIPIRIPSTTQLEGGLVSSEQDLNAPISQHILKVEEQSIVTKYESKLAAAKDHHRAELDDVRFEYESKLKALKEDNDATVWRQKIEHERMVAASEEKHSSEIEERKQRQLEAERIATARGKLIQDHEQMLVDIAKERMAEIEYHYSDLWDVEKRLATQSDQYRKETDRNNTSHQHALAEYKDQVKTLQDQHRADIKGMNDIQHIKQAAEYERKALGVKEQHQAEIKHLQGELKKGFDKKMSNLKKRHRSKIKSNSEIHQRRIAEIEQGVERKLLDQNLKHKNRMTSTAERHKAGVKLFNITHFDQCLELIAKCENQLKRQHGAELERISLERNADNAEYESKLSNLTAKSQQKLASLNEQHAADLQEQVDAQIESILVDQKEEYEGKVSSLEEKLSMEKENFAVAQKKLEEQYENRLIEMEEKHRKEMDTEVSACNETVSEYDGEMVWNAIIYGQKMPEFESKARETAEMYLAELDALKKMATVREAELKKQYE